MNIHQTNIPFEEGDEQRLWDYIDGISSPSEKTVIEQLLEANAEWRAKYHELLDVHQLMQSSELEQPSMRFTKNVMDEIARLQIAPATSSYINKNIKDQQPSHQRKIKHGIIICNQFKTEKEQCERKQHNYSPVQAKLCKE